MITIKGSFNEIDAAKKALSGREIEGIVSYEYTDMVFIMFTHEADADGCCCEAVIKYFSDITSNKIRVPECYRCSYNNFEHKVMEGISKLPDKELYTVLITDLSFNINVYNYLVKENIHFLWIDHHQVPKDYADLVKSDRRFIIYPDEYREEDLVTLSEKDSFLYDMKCDFGVDYKNCCRKISAAALVFYYFEHMFEDCVRGDEIGITNVITMISDADTYAWTKRLSPYHIGCEFFGLIPDMFSLIFKYEGYDQLLTQLIDVFGDLTTMHELSTLSKMVGSSKLYDRIRQTQFGYWKKSLCPFRFKTKNDDGKISDLLVYFTPVVDQDFSIFSYWFLNELKENGDVVDHIATMCLYPDSRTISCRNLDESSYNLAELMSKYFGGGGHLHAAGGKMTPATIFGLLASYWEKRDPKVKDKGIREICTLSSTTTTVHLMLSIFTV